MPTDTAPNAAQLILASVPAQGRPAAGQGLPEGLTAGHRYSYRLGSRMGMAYAQADGSMTLKPGGITADWITRHAHLADWVHAPLSCAGCGR